MSPRLFFQDEARIGPEGLRLSHLVEARRAAAGLCGKRLTFAYTETAPAQTLLNFEATSTSRAA